MKIISTLTRIVVLLHNCLLLCIMTFEYTEYNGTNPFPLHTLFLNTKVYILTITSNQFLIKIIALSFISSSPCLPRLQIYSRTVGVGDLFINAKGFGRYECRRYYCDRINRRRFGRLSLQNSQPYSDTI